MWSLKGNTSSSIIMTQVILKVLLWKFSLTSFKMHQRKQILLLLSPNPVSFNNARKILEQIFSLSVTGCYWLCSCSCLQIPKATADNWQNEQNTSPSLLLVLSVTWLNKLIRLLMWLWVIPQSAKMGTMASGTFQQPLLIWELDLHSFNSSTFLCLLPRIKKTQIIILSLTIHMYACVGVYIFSAGDSICWKRVSDGLELELETVMRLKPRTSASVACTLNCWTIRSAQISFLPCLFLRQIFTMM